MRRLAAFLVVASGLAVGEAVRAQQPTSTEAGPTSSAAGPAVGPGMGSQAKNDQNYGPTVRTAMDRKRKTVRMQARQTIQALFQRLCPGRCELVELSVEMKDPEMLTGVDPGFTGSEDQAYSIEPETITTTVLLDSKLPGNFGESIPRMIEYQLKELAPTIQVRRESLDFPEPQPRPSASDRRPRRPRPRPKRKRLPEPKEKKEEPEEPDEPKPKAKKKKKKKDDEEEQEGWGALLAGIAPWIGPTLMMLVLGLLAFPLLRRLGEIVESDRTGGGAPGEAGTDGGGPDVAGLRNDLMESRAVRNRVLRRWIREDPEGVADLVRLVGPGILDDLKTDEQLDDELEEVGTIVSSRREPLSDEEAERVARETRARLRGARLTHDGQGLAENWDFLEGIGVPTLRKILETCDTEERLHVVGQLPSALRASYLDSLDSDERRRLFLAAGSSDLSKQESMALASRLRRSAEEYGHLGSEAEGQAELVVDMIQSLEYGEQVDTIRELRQNRPEVADVVLSEVCLESTATVAPDEAVADAVHRTPVETLVAFLQGTDERVRARVLDVAPAQKRDALDTELSLDVPVAREDYLDARAEFTSALERVLHRQGHDLADLNLQALDGRSS